jgi:hypothetical protein
MEYVVGGAIVFIFIVGAIGMVDMVIQLIKQK